MSGLLDGSAAPWYVWQMAAKAALSSSSAQTSVGKSKASSMPASLLNFVHVQVVECKVAVALVAVGHIGGYHIGVSRVQGHHLAGQMNLCLALGDQKQTGEGRRHTLPVQSAWWRENPTWSIIRLSDSIGIFMVDGYLIMLQK